MNANELADALQETEPYYSTDYKLFDKAATMLRQQQEEIEALKSKTLTEDTECQYCKQGCIRCDARKLLTDEEIDAVGDEVSNLIDTYAGRREFARAILRKASEK